MRFIVGDLVGSLVIGVDFEGELVVFPVASSKFVGFGVPALKGDLDGDCVGGRDICTSFGLTEGGADRAKYSSWLSSRLSFRSFPTSFAHQPTFLTPSLDDCCTKYTEKTWWQWEEQRDGGSLASKLVRRL